jgi:hypothetical protein
VRSKVMVPVVLAAAVVWIVGVTVLVAREPSTGARQPEQLASAYQDALDAGDAKAIEKLLAEPPEKREFAAELERSFRCPGGGTHVRVGGTEPDLFLEFVDDAHRPCGRLGIVERHRRWFVGVVPQPVAAPPGTAR